jgi:3-oxoadipate enol-lactonase
VTLRTSFPGPAGELSVLEIDAHASERSPVLFLHPINLAAEAWVEVAEALSPPRRAILPDLRGHGRSTADGPFGIEAWEEDALAALDHVGVAAAHVVGGSLGGTLAVRLAGRHPNRVLSIAAFGSTLHVEGADLAPVENMLRELGPQATFARILPDLAVAPGTPAEVIESILAITNPNDGPTVAAVWRAALATDVRGDAARVRCPALVVSGELDKTCPPEQGREMSNRIGGEFILLPRIGHLPMFECPSRTAQIVSAHLADAEAE